MANKKKGNKVIKVALFGTFVGGTIGLLFAPKSGQELRQDIAEQANKVEDKAVEIREKAQNTWENVEEKTQEAVSNGKKWIEKGKQMVSNLKTIVTKISRCFDKD